MNTSKNLSITLNSSGPELVVWNVGVGQRVHHPLPVHLEVEVDDVVEHPLLVQEEPRAAELARQLTIPCPPLGASVNKSSIEQVICLYF